MGLGPSASPRQDLRTLAWRGRWAILPAPATDDPAVRYAAVLHQLAAECGPDDGVPFRRGVLLENHPMPENHVAYAVALRLLSAIRTGPVAPW